MNAPVDSIEQDERNVMNRHRIAVIPGDGIGNEVVPEGIRVLEAVADRFDITDPMWTVFRGRTQANCFHAVFPVLNDQIR